MEIFTVEEYLKKENPNPGERYVEPILTGKQKAVNIGAIFGILPAGGKGAYHFHNRRESIIIAISGEAVRIIEGREVPVKANDIIYTPAMEKHGAINRTDKDFRYLEFFTVEPGVSDRVEVDNK